MLATSLYNTDIVRTIENAAAARRHGDVTQVAHANAHFVRLIAYCERLGLVLVSTREGGLRFVPRSWMADDAAPERTAHLRVDGYPTAVHLWPMSQHP